MFEFAGRLNQGNPMKNLIIATAFCIAGLSGSAFAADAPAKTNSKMASCNKDSAGKTGDDRKAFMSTCLSAKPAAPVKAESKMSTCNKASTGKTGDDKKSFMSTCLSAKPAA
jgi:hypothetical protein